MTNTSTNPSGYHQRLKTTQQKFWEKVDIGKTNECWNWIGAKRRAGYGILVVDKRTRSAHRLALELAGQDVPQDKVVMHVCDNKLCVNPTHLRVGTQKQNQKDKFIKGRQAKGEQHGMARLTQADVLRIRRKRLAGISIYQLAKAYDISWTHAHRIIHRKSWRCV